MARRKKPEDENASQTLVRQQLEAVANSANRSEKVSFDRKMEAMLTLIEKLTPIEDKILDLMASKLPIVDQISSIRSDMVLLCVHPFEQLVHNDDHVLCKFCNRRFNVNVAKKKA